jgi:chromosome partitioning protein
VKIFATYNIKGGVGKTTAAVNLAHLSAADGYRTLLWDLDPQGAASFLFRIKPRVKGGGKALIRGRKALDDAIKGTDFDDLDLLPADFTYRNMDLLLGDTDSKPTRKIAQLLRPLAAEYDHVFLDCPPSISLVSENVMHAADVLLVPLIPTTLSVRTLDQLTEFVAGFHGRRPEIRAFFSMVDNPRPYGRTARCGGHSHPRSLPDRAHVRGACPGHRFRPPQRGRPRLPRPLVRDRQGAVVLSRRGPARW